jgi:hypothetical protein
MSAMGRMQSSGAATDGQLATRDARAIQRRATGSQLASMQRSRATTFLRGIHRSMEPNPEGTLKGLPVYTTVRDRGGDALAVSLDH